MAIVPEVPEPFPHRLTFPLRGTPCANRFRTSQIPVPEPFSPLSVPFTDVWASIQISTTQPLGFEPMVPLIPRLRPFPTRLSPPPRPALHGFSQRKNRGEGSSFGAAKSLFTHARSHTESTPLPKKQTVPHKRLQRSVQSRARGVPPQGIEPLPPAPTNLPCGTKILWPMTTVHCQTTNSPQHLIPVILKILLKKSTRSAIPKISFADLKILQILKISFADLKILIQKEPQ